MMNMSIEQGVLFGSEAPASCKRMALSVMLSNEGIDTPTTARIVGVSERQVRNHKKAYVDKGSAALTGGDRYRPASALEEHADAIKADLLARPVATAAEARKRIFELTGIKRSPTQVRAFMHKLGLKPLKVASIPAKADPVKQEEFLEESLDPRIEEAKAGKRVLLFMDAAHFVWQLYLGVLWCVSRIFIRAASGRTRINVLGAYDPIKNELTKIINRTYITSTTVIELLEKISASYINKAITVVLDNARYQRCQAVIDKAAALNIELLFLPTYSPNLNLIERLWRFVKKDCLYSKHYSSANEFETAIETCLGEINKSKKESLKTLMALKFQKFSAEPFDPQKGWVAAA
jgi:transposase